MTDSATVGLIYSAIIGSVLFVVFVLLFEILRKKRDHIFLYRKYLVAHKSKYPNFKDENGDFPEFISPTPTSSWFSWIRATMSISEEDIATQISYDGALMLKALKNRLAFLLGAGLLAFIVLAPTYGTAPRRKVDGCVGTECPYFSEGLGIISMANLPPNSNRLWATFIVDVFLVIAGLMLCYKETVEFVRKREQYRSKNIGANYAVSIMDLPADFTTTEQVRSAFETALPGEIEGVQLVYNAPTLQKKFVRYGQALENREKAEWAILNPAKGKEGVRPTLKTKPCCFGETVDSQQYWGDLQGQYAEEITSAQHEMDPAIVKKTKSAIVIFRSKKAAAAASQLQIFTKPMDMSRITRLDSFKAVHWPGIKKPRWLGIIFSVHTWLWMVVFLAFWVVVTTAVISLANLQSLANIEALAFLKPLLDAAAPLTGFIEGFLPPILQIVLALLPKILIKIFVSLEAIPSNALMGAKQRDLVFIFLFFNSFVYVVVAGTALEQLATILDQPTIIVSLLAEGIPQQATFFMNFVLSLTFIANGLALSQIVRIIVQWVFRTFLGMKTPRLMKKVHAFAGVFQYAPVYTAAAIIGAIATVYSTIAPALMLFAAFWFALTYIVAKHNICFTTYNPFDNGGWLSWGHIHINFAALYIKQLTMIGIFGLNVAPVPSAVSIIMLFVILAVHIFLIRRFRRMAWEGSLEYTGSKVSDVDVNPVYVQKYITPELRDCRTGVPDMLEIEELKPVSEDGKTINGDLEAGKPEEAPEKFYDTEVNENIETAA